MEQIDVEAFNSTENKELTTSKSTESDSDLKRTQNHENLSIPGSKKMTHATTSDNNQIPVPVDPKKDQQQVAISRFLSIHLFGSISNGHFDSFNDIYLKYSIVSGPDWVLASGSDVGVTQISRYKKGAMRKREFIWNQPITVSYRSYNYFGWPQIILSVYYFDTFGNDQILGYGCTYLPISSQMRANTKQVVTIYAPQSTSTIRRILCWILGKKPELLESNLFTRADCRSLLQMISVGEVEVSFNMISKDVTRQTQGSEAHRGRIHIKGYRHATRSYWFYK